MRPYKLFEKLGVEVEYMLADRSTMAIKPVADAFFRAHAGKDTSDVENGAVTWSNELVNHVIELKVTEPQDSLEGIEEHFYKNLLQIHDELAPFGATILPGGMHPWMDPSKETELWPGEGHEIYEQYDRIFNCHRHGWANIQSVHLNISFRTDEEFERLHAAIRVLLPILPAYTAASPVADGKITRWKDTRLEHYRTNQKIMPSIGGKIIPEPVFSEADYEREIFSKLMEEIKEHDAEGLLKRYFLNSRGAIARFDRGSIEIRLIDAQECPKADFAILALIVPLLKRMVREEPAAIDAMKSWGTDDLAAIFVGCVQSAGEFVIENTEYRTLFGMEAGPCKAKDIWAHIMKTFGPEKFREVYDLYQSQGTLSDRLLASLSPEPTRDDLANMCKRLNSCLLKNRLFVPEK